MDDQENVVQRIMQAELQTAQQEFGGDLTEEQWNQVYIELSQEMVQRLALQLIEDSKYDICADYETFMRHEEQADLQKVNCCLQ